MKSTLLLFTLIAVLASCSASKEKLHNGSPVISAQSDRTEYRIGNEWSKGQWRIAPEVEHDTLKVTYYSPKLSFEFKTDIDNITFELSPNTSKDFYVKMDDNTYAHTVVQGIAFQPNQIKFDTVSKNNKLKFWYEQNNNNKYLNELRSKYPIDSLIKNTKTDTEKTLEVLHWVHKQWQHNGNNVPQKSDAISILEEVKDGKNFRCVEYGIVATACLNAVGLKARTLALKTKNVETTQYGAGHVLLEVYLNDLKKWVIIDGQWDAMPMLNGIPLNAVEFQKAISENYNDLEIRTSSNTSKKRYVDWIYPYLYYFDISFDNREGTDIERKKINEKKSLMLVPIGAKKPTVFQIKHKIDNCIYTNSLNDFYKEPK